MLFAVAVFERSRNKIINLGCRKGVGKIVQCTLIGNVATQG